MYGFTGSMTAADTGRSPRIMKNITRLFVCALLAGVIFVTGSVQSSFAQSGWTNVSEAPARQSVAFGNGIFVAVGNGGSVETSSDGILWTRRNSGSAVTLNRVRFGNGLFVVAGNGGTILTSPDGTNWTTRNSGTTKTLFGIHYAKGAFFMTGDETILKSVDGITWTAPGIPPAQFMLDITYGNGLFVVACFSGAILTSADGTAWAPASSPAPGFLYSVIFSNNLFVAAGDQGTVVTSADGTNWTLRTSNTSAQLTGVAFAASRFVVTGVNVIITSTDGVSWTTVTPDPSRLLTGIAYGNGFFTAIGPGGISMSSSGGTSWSVHQTGFPVSDALRSISFFGQFVVTGENGMYTSSNGRDWVLQPGFVNQFVGGITHTPNGTLFACSTTGRILQSSTGTSWGSSEFLENSPLYDIAYGAGRLVVVGGNAVGTAYWSVNGSGWTPGTLAQSLTKVRFINGQFVGIASHTSALAGFYTSANGESWTYKNIIYQHMTGIAYGQGLYVAVGKEGEIHTSPDLVTWTARQSGTQQNLTSVIYAYGYFVAVGANGTILTSTDGIDWESRASHTDRYLANVAAADGIFIAVGDGVILYAPADHPLPVTMVSFTVNQEGKTAGLQWATSSESRSGQFDIERSHEGKVWETIGSVPAKGEAEGITRYTFTDAQPYEGTNLYRLKSVDRDGTFAYGLIRSLKFEGDSGIVLYPNPAANELHITWSGPDKPEAIQIISASGTVRSEPASTRLLDLSQLPPGLYTILFKLKDRRYSRKISVVR